jgi:hypothetical protein
VKVPYAILIALVTGVFAAVLSGFAILMPPFWAVVTAVPVAAGTFLALALVGVLSPSWHPVPALDESLTMHQASGLANRFDEAVHDQRRFQVRVQPRLQRLALARLRQHFHDLESLHDERARHALGADLHTLLTDKDARMPSPKRLTELLARLEET